MSKRSETKALLVMVVGLTVCFWLPVGHSRFDQAVLESFHLVRWYAREHVLLCLIPAFFIAGAVGVFVSQASVMTYLGGRANRVLAYGVASISGTILAVCSCTVLPLFAGIYRMGAGLGPACAFLYSGPAINVLAIVLTARVLGLRLGIARAVGAIVFSIVIGLLMHLFFRKAEAEKAEQAAAMPVPEAARPLWQTALYFATMVGVLVFANLGTPEEIETVLWRLKWPLTAGCAAALGLVLILWFDVPWWRILLAAIAPTFLAVVGPTAGLWILLPFGAGVAGLALVLRSCPGEMETWMVTTWSFAKQILPLLLAGGVVAGFMLGRVGHEGLIPSGWVAGLVGGNSISANVFASILGALMYFATLTEVPILQGLIGAGMGEGPALALLLAGPALSLPNMLVIRSILGTKKTDVFVLLVVTMATLTGILYGAMVG